MYRRIICSQLYWASFTWTLFTVNLAARLPCGARFAAMAWELVVLVSCIPSKVFKLITTPPPPPSSSGLHTPSLGSLPAAELLSHIPTFVPSSSAALAAPGSVATPPVLAWSVSSSAPGGAGPPLAAQLAALLKGAAQQEASARDRVTIGPGLPTIPRKLLDKMHRWEYIDLAELLPQTSAHDAATPEVDPHRFVLFPGCEFIKPKKHRIESISEWVKAFAIYTAAMGNKFVEAIPEMLAYLLVIVNASEQYDGMYWRTYDTHFRVNAAATGNRQWARLDIDLYTRFFTGRAKAVASCSICDATAHSADRCPLKPRVKAGKLPAGAPAASPRKRKWPGDVCFGYNATGDCTYKAACKYRHTCGTCGGKHPAKSCGKE